MSHGPVAAGPTPRVGWVQVEVVINNGAGSVDGDEADAERERVLAAFAAHDVEPRVALVQGEDLEAALQEAVARDPDVVAVGGGDGSLGTAAAVVAAAGTTLGVLPMGTFNNFAKDLGIPVELEAAAGVVVAGRTMRIDLAEVNGRTFVNNSSIGLYPVMVDLRDDIRSSRGWGKVRSVPVAALRVLRRFPTRRLHVAGDGEHWDLRSPFVFVGNNAYEVGPSGVGARTSLTEGELCCYVARVESRLAFVGLAVRALLRGAASTPRLESLATDEVVVTAGDHRLLVAIDGEVVTLRSPLRYRLRAGALAVRVPSDEEPPIGPPEAEDAGSGAR